MPERYSWSPGPMGNPFTGRYAERRPAPDPTGGLLAGYRAQTAREVEAFRNPPPARGKPSPAKPKAEALRIFVGGAIDNAPVIGGHNMDAYYERYRSGVDGPALYFSHVQEPEIAGAIVRATADGVPVDVIGHSYGGVAGYNAILAAGKKGGRVRDFVSADPVGRMARGDGRPGNVETWINITADPSDPEFVDRFIAPVGGKAAMGTPNIQRPGPLEPFGVSHVPTNDADQTFVLDRNHDELADMLRDAGVTDRLFRGEALDDHMPIVDWMKVRDGQGRSRR